MNKFFKIAGIVILIMISCYFIWLNLPVQVNRFSDIKQGEIIIKNIENYKAKYNHLPEKNCDTLVKLEFKLELLGTTPEYNRLNDTTYELVFFEGFDGPYLLWNSNDKLWKIDFPKYPKK